MHFPAAFENVSLALVARSLRMLLLSVVLRCAVVLFLCVCVAAFLFHRAPRIRPACRRAQIPLSAGAVK